MVGVRYISFCHFLEQLICSVVSLIC